ncbi:hypothetical protein CDAR_367471 [Caerostris darwini]|uniref:Uncharacterized protein n=1 Tax=Caerostris darwini TaxID=1538125 RepID=A0AAV4SN21_9ARAC|nr:hypothetical protein CDAR_367471 [Caerostris darwini]
MQMQFPSMRKSAKTPAEVEELPGLEAVWSRTSNNSNDPNLWTGTSDYHVVAAAHSNDHLTLFFRAAHSPCSSPTFEPFLCSFRLLSLGRSTLLMSEINWFGWVSTRFVQPIRLP